MCVKYKNHAFDSKVCPRQRMRLSLALNDPKLFSQHSWPVTLPQIKGFCIELHVMLIKKTMYLNAT